MEQFPQGVKSGYLYQDFRYFHITDRSDKTFDYHYHEFNKIIIFLSGNVTYVIEGKSYKLKPWDILLINHHDVHRPIIDGNETYDRIILWVGSEFLERFSTPEANLTTCFTLADKKSFNLVRLEVKLQEKIQSIVENLETAYHSKEFGSSILSQALFVELLIYLNRVHLNNSYIYDQNSMEYDKQIVEILDYIKRNIENNLSIDKIASEFFLSKHYLVHKFKAKTGYTLHHYILNKRLFRTIELIKNGTPITVAAAQCGFQDYSTFSRAFRKTYHCSPREFFSSEKE